jgi:hypothetical protein
MLKQPQVLPLIAYLNVVIARMRDLVSAAEQRKGKSEGRAKV